MEPITFPFSARNRMSNFFSLKLILLVLIHWILVAGEETSCKCFCPNFVGNAAASGCSSAACASACYNQFPECTNVTTYGCCQGFWDLFAMVDRCGSYPSSNNCDCFCDSNKFIGTALALSTSPSTYAKACAKACYDTFSGQCSVTNIRGCASTYNAQACAYYKRNYTCDCTCRYENIDLDSVPGNVCSATECAAVCYKAYFKVCSLPVVQGCTADCGPQSCQTYEPLDVNSITSRKSCYCNCPTAVGITRSRNCDNCTSNCLDDFPICKIHSASAWGSCEWPGSTTTTTMGTTITWDGEHSTNIGNCVACNIPYYAITLFTILVSYSVK